MESVVLDSSVLIGFFHPDDAHHSSSSAELAEGRTRGDRFVLPATVLSESLVNSYRRSPHNAAELRRRIVGLFGPVRVVDEAVAVEAARLRAAYRWLRMPDALVVATGIVENATVLTCDQRLADLATPVRLLET
ncbi:MAG TPA: PIN domain-containing protein [Pseudonocardia sp.]|jgi:predicted nucleic acid-binding protein|uniref:type II toxin-antitoxin system VapC family toxin n=1 Tax=Pseudonocardia sp. TaxID=60912 RepID=UPI002F3EFCF3